MFVKECCCVKLSSNKKSILGLRMGSQILYLLLFISCVAVGSVADSKLSCSSVKSIFEKKGMVPGIEIQEQPISDAGGLCSRSSGCCAGAARTALVQQARAQLEMALRSELNKLSSVLANRAKRFDEYFRKLLQQSREEFHTMFKRTYGMIYEKHSYVFEQLYEELERYYTHGDTDFDAMMNRFFGILYQKMFTVLNAQYSFDDEYLRCVETHMPDIEPFEDVPHKLSVQLRRAFVATRTFYKALRIGADIVRNMTQVGVTQECVTAWARLRFCSSCEGQEVPACSRYCHNVIKGCLPLHADLGEQWDAYVDAVEKVADRLLGPFNIAMVVQPIDIKISEAIMSFQEHNQEISQKIFTNCGKPVLGGGESAGPFFTQERTRRFARALPDFDWRKRDNDVDDFELETSYESILSENPSLINFKTAEGIRKATEDLVEQAKLRDKFLQYMRGDIKLDEYEEHERRRRDVTDSQPADASDAEIDPRAFEFDGKKGPKRKKPTGDNPEDGHDQLVRDTRQRMRMSRRYWSQLPVLLCSPASVTTLPCFNGTAVSSYTLSSAGEGTAALESNPEVRGGAPPTSSEAVRSLESLKSLTAKLKDAYNGVEVHWSDSDDLQAQSSFLDFADTAGSGSGSGSSIDDTEDLPDDDEDRAPPEYGSGANPSEDDDEEQPRILINRPTVDSVPETIVPRVLVPPETNNVQQSNGETPPARVDPPSVANTDPSGGQGTPVRESPPKQAASSLSLNKALFTYALPVVCAWFGTIVTDLF